MRLFLDSTDGILIRSSLLRRVGLLKESGRLLEDLVILKRYLRPYV